MNLIEIRHAADQDRGGFDGGNILERKPVNFPGVGTQRIRYGPLLYWAWAWAESGGLITEHSHQGFEIVSYVLKGRIEHQDSLGSPKSVGAGAIQVMQANSGMHHSELFVSGERTEIFQIWFEPDLRQAITRPPRYSDVHANSLPWKEMAGYRIKHILGPDASLRLEAEAQFDDVVVERGGTFGQNGNAQYLIAVAIEGKGNFTVGDTSVRVGPGDAVYGTLTGGTPVRVTAPDGEFRFAKVVVPQRVGYPLYPDLGLESGKAG